MRRSRLGPLPANLLADRALLRLQALQLLPGGTLLATNQVFLEYATNPAARVRVEAVGKNSFNTESERGFFRITRLATGSPITRVVLSWVGSPAAQATMVFDQYSSANGEQFSAGNSTVPGSV